MTKDKNILDQKIAEREKLEKEIEKLIAQQRKDVLAQIREDVKRFDIAAEEIFGGKPARARKAAGKKPGALKAKAPVKPKYLDPATGKTWSGRGRTPKWLEGKNPEDFAI